MRPRSLAVLGLGAIGGSVAWQARRAGLASVTGYAPDRFDCVQALKACAVHDVADSPARAVRGADLVVLAAPPAAVLELLGAIAPFLAPDAVVTDVTSIKLPVLARARAAGLAARFAGSHPFAGTHQSGWTGARPDRFLGARVYVCPTGPEGEAAVREVMNFWQEVLGAEPVRISAEAHDAQLAWTSHLPQAMASALARTLAGVAELQGASYAGGARDTTRLAASPPEMWAEIFMLNAAPVAAALAGAEGRLAELRGLIERGDAAALTSFLAEAADFRRALDHPAPGATG